MRLPRPSCHALRVIFLGASHHALASPRAFCYAFRTRSYRVLSHNQDLLHLIRGPMLGLLSVPHPERRSIRASCNHVLLAEPSLRRCFHPLPIVDILSGCDITSMGICLSRGCPTNAQKLSAYWGIIFIRRNYSSYSVDLARSR